MTTLLILSINQRQITTLQQKELQCLVLAESGLAKGIWQLKNQPEFYTDSDFSGLAKNLKDWLINTTQGHTEALNDGHYKIIKEKNKNRLFSIGYLGDKPTSAAARKVLQLDYDIVADQFIKRLWQEL